MDTVNRISRDFRIANKLYDTTDWFSDNFTRTLSRIQQQVGQILSPENFSVGMKQSGTCFTVEKFIKHYITGQLLVLIPNSVSTFFVDQCPIKISDGYKAIEVRLYENFTVYALDQESLVTVVNIMIKERKDGRFVFEEKILFEGPHEYLRGKSNLAWVHDEMTNHFLDHRKNVNQNRKKDDKLLFLD